MSNGKAKEQGNLSLMFRMLGLVKPMTGVMIASVVCGVLGFLCAIFIPVLAAGTAYSLIVGEQYIAPLGQVIALLFVMAVLRGVLHYIEQTCNHYIAFKLLAHIRDLVFGALRKLAPAKLAGRDKGSLVSTITSDVELLEVFYAHTISPVAIAVLTSVVMIVLMGQYHWVFALVAAIAYVVIGFVVPVAISKMSGTVGREAREQQGRLSSFMLDALRGLGEVLQFGAAGNRLRLLDEESSKLVGIRKRQDGVASTGVAMASALILIFSLAQLSMGVLLFQQGEVGALGTIVSTVMLFSSFGPVIALANLGSTLQGTLASGRRVLGILDEKPMVEENIDGLEISFTNAKAENVDFSYGEEQVLRDVNVEVPKGEIVGIKGRSGSGKSTLCRLFMRFWDVDSGRIAFDQQDVRSIKTTSLRNSEAFVEQDTYLFHNSIRDNLLIAKPDATQEQIE